MTSVPARLHPDQRPSKAVGYGDFSPKTDGGRAIAIVVMFVGIGFIVILTAAAGGRFLREQRAETNALEGVEQRLDEVLRRLAVIEQRQHE